MARTRTSHSHTTNPSATSDIISAMSEFPRTHGHDSRRSSRAQTRVTHHRSSVQSQCTTHSMSKRQIKFSKKLQGRLNRNVPNGTFDFDWGTTGTEKGRSSLIGLSRDANKIHSWRFITSQPGETTVSKKEAVWRLHEAITGLDLSQTADLEVCSSAVKTFQRSMWDSYKDFQSGVTHQKAMYAKSENKKIKKKGKKQTKRRRGRGGPRGATTTRSDAPITLTEVTASTVTS